MHGEYKMPGGKLVVADLVVEAGRLARVQISGDFFLQPDSALQQINDALTGLSVNGSHAERVSAITAALDTGVQMYGVDADAVATAVARALENKQ